MTLNKSLLLIPLLATLVGAGAGILEGRGATAETVTASEGQIVDGDSHITRAQAAGGLGIVVPQSGRAPAPSAQPVGSMPSQQLPRQYVAGQPAQSQAPLMRGLGDNPDVLLNVMRMVRNNPQLRAEALNRMRSSGMGGAAAGGMTDEMLAGTLDSLLADPGRLEAILGEIGSTPGLLQGMLGQMGMEGVSQQEIDFLLQRVGNDPDLLAGLAAGDPSAVNGLSDDLAGHMAGGQPDLSGALAPLAQGGGARAGYGASYAPTQVAPGYGGYGSYGGYAGYGGGMGGAPMMGSDMLGTGASLSLLADMLGTFGGGDTSELQGALRAGDLNALYGMVNELYGPNGALSNDPALGGGPINSYTDLLDALMDME